MEGKCKFCSYEWSIRVDKPKQCPKCKRYDYELKETVNVRKLLEELKGTPSVDTNHQNTEMGATNNIEVETKLQTETSNGVICECGKEINIADIEIVHDSDKTVYYHKLCYKVLGNDLIDVIVSKD